MVRAPPTPAPRAASTSRPGPRPCHVTLQPATPRPPPPHVTAPRRPPSPSPPRAGRGRGSGCACAVRREAPPSGRERRGPPLAGSSGRHGTRGDIGAFSGSQQRRGAGSLCERSLRRQLRFFNARARPATQRFLMYCRWSTIMSTQVRQGPQNLFPPDWEGCPTHRNQRVSSDHIKIFSESKILRQSFY